MSDSTDIKDDRCRECEALLRATISPGEELEKLVTALRATRSLLGGYQHYLEEADSASSIDRKRLHTVVNLYELAGENATIIHDLLQGHGDPLSIAGVAEEAYSRIPCPKGLPLKRGLFQQDPTAVLLGMLGRHEFPVPAAIQDLVGNVLQTAVTETQFNILTTPFHVLVWEEGDANNDGGENEQRNVAQETLAALRRLSLVVEYPEDVAVLLELGFKSASRIAACPLGQFTTRAPAGLLGSLTRIHAQATLIDSRNEHLWAQLRAVPGGPLSALQSWEMEGAGVGVAAGEEAGAAEEVITMETHYSALEAGPANRAVNQLAPNRTQLQPLYAQVAAAADVLVDMDNVACEDCCSLLSPSAYFVDLLRLLKNCWIDPKRLATGPSVLDRLLARRPDLQHMQLSCANTKIELPYIDVCNELMESLVEFLEDTSRESYGTYNCRDGETAAALAAEPLNVNWTLYDLYLGRLTTPMTTLPFDLRTEVARHLLAAIGTSRRELLEIMQSPHRYGAPGGASAHAIYIQRAVAAEALGLTEQGFRAIAHEPLWPPADGQPAPAAPSAAECWGFPAADEASLGENLSLIQDQLLPRAGITFIDLVAILRTSWLGGTLLVQNPEIPGDFTKLQSLRLLGPDGQLASAGVFHRLGTFIHLFVRLGWSVEELDQALAVCRANSVGGISAGMLVQLSAIKRLTDLCHQPVSQLLPLWQGQSGGSIASKVYHMLGIPETAGVRFLRLVTEDRVRDPVHALELATQWRDLVSRGWSVEELIGLSSSVEEHLEDASVSASVAKLASNMIYEDVARENASEPASSQPATNLLPQLFLLEQLKGLTENVEPRILELLLDSLSQHVDRIRIATHAILKERDPSNQDRTVPPDFMQLVGEFHQALSRGLRLISHADLTPELLRRLQQSSNFKIDLSDWSLWTVQEFMGFAGAPGPGDSRIGHPPFELMLWAGQTTATTPVELAKQVARTLGVTVSRAESLLRVNYPDVAPETLLALLADPSGIEPQRLARQVSWISRCGLHEVKLSLLFGMGEVVASAEPPQIEDLLAALAGRQSSLQTMHNELRERRRDALIQYLLQHPSIQAQNVRDADSLFEYLLLDVQMGAAMRTNRMAQAIASLQLFVQRCLLGLEPGITASVIPTDRWSWMQQYRLWEANRKVFLYPENWVDPSLRDNKTPAFEDFERDVLQSELNEESVTALVKKYIYQVHETAQLHIQSYHWDRRASRASYTIHVVGRTRSSPFTFYYRRLDGLVVGTKVAPTWSPWEKLGVDIPTHVTDESGQALSEAGAYVVPVMMNQQLHLFIAHITSKTRPLTHQAEKAPIEGKYPQPGAKPQGYWEMKLGLTIQRGREWSPVAISHASLDVDGLAVDGGQLPSVDSFRFWTHKVRIVQRVADEERPGKTKLVTSTRLTIYVDRWAKDWDNVVSVPVGSFQLRGQEILAYKPTPPPTTYEKTTATVFGRIIPDMGYPSDLSVQNWRSKWGVTLADDAEQMVLADMPTTSLTKIPDNALRTVQWTTSLDSYSQSSALVLDIAQANAETAQTWVAVPQSASLIKDSMPAPVPVRFDHVVSPALVEAATVFDDLASIYMTMRDGLVVPTSLEADVFGGFCGDAYKESATPAAIYNWELGFHMVSLLMERLLAVQKYDLALRVARQVFDPRMGREQQQQLAASDRTTVCWRFAPFRKPEVREAGSLSTILRTAQQSSGAEDAMAVPVLEWRRNPFNAHSVARNRPLVYMKRTAMKYIEILIAAGDHHFRQFTAESIPLAIQRYVEAAHIFGPAPAAMPKTASPVVRSYAQLSDSLNDMSNAHVDLEVLLPFHLPPHARAALPSSSSASQTLVGIVPSSYFCVGINPDIVRLRSTIDNRLSKIRHSLDIDGHFRTPPSSGPAINPGEAGRRLLAGSSTTAVSPAGDEGPMPNYRFMNLLQRALDLAQELKTSGATYLSIKERRDGEALAALNASHECTVQALVLKIKESQLAEAEKTLAQLQESRRSPLMRLEYYSKLTGDEPIAPTATQDFIPIEQLHVPLSKRIFRSGQIEISRLNALEATEIEKAMTAGTLNVVASGADVIASTLAMLPGLSTQVSPWGIGVNVSSPPWGQRFSLVASVARWQAQMRTEDSIQASRVNRLHTQLQDRRLQANLAGFELQGIQKQIDTHQHRIDAMKHETKLQQAQIDHSLRVKEYLMSKWTKDELYSWLDNSLRDHLYHTYILALRMAQQAERALQFETGRGPGRGTTIPSAGVWDSTHDGLLAGEGLYRALKHLEREYIHHQPNSLEVVKSVSLRQVDPLALLRVREEGTASFSLPEELFDLDYPGHYHRRIKSVAVTIPCILGPYSSVNCTLTLTGHDYRVDPLVNAHGTDYVRTGPGDPRFHKDTIPTSAIAVSHGQNDPGVATLDFNGERYMPMEGAGAISDWTIALPSKYRSFDYRTISDVVLHIRYTARDGGEQLAKAATAHLGKYFEAAATLSASTGLYTLLDVPNDFSSAWHALKRPAGGVRVLPQSIPLHDLSNMIPFYARYNGVSTIREIFVFIGWESVDRSALSRLQVKFQDQLLSCPSEDGHLGLLGHTCFHATNLAVSMSPSPALGFDLLRPATGQDSPQDITLIKDQDEVESKKVGALIEQMVRVFVLFRYQMAYSKK